jgi:hypothetical protein
MSNDLVLSRIEAILSDLEALDAETGGIYRQPSDREAFDVVTRIERAMQAQKSGAAE